jgi:hypothetical protein
VYYTSVPQRHRERRVPYVDDLRKSLDDLFTYQAEAEEAPASFQADEELARWIRERERVLSLLSSSPMALL